jgi:flagellar P-ring protein precursor FlgI
MRKSNEADMTQSMNRTPSSRPLLAAVLGVWASVMAGMMAFTPAPAQASSIVRLKDVVNFEGIRENMLIGYGLVVGLNGTGDKLQNNAFTEQSLIAFLERQGVNTRGSALKTRNVAAVTVTASLPPFARTGGRIDVNLGAMGDAKSLQGGTLLATALYGADGEVYAVAQGAVTVGGFTAGGQSGSTVTKGVPTSGYIANGAAVEKEIDFALNDMREVKVALKNPDLSTARNIAEAINGRLGPDSASISDPGTVTIRVPQQYNSNVAMLLADIEQVVVQTDQVARIIIDEASGTIVMGENVRIDPVAVAQGNLVVRVEETPQVSQPGPFAPAGAETVVVPRSTISVDENSQARMAVLESGATLRDLVAGLNALGVGPRDLITILQNIKASGALQASIETR